MENIIVIYNVRNNSVKEKSDGNTLTIPSELAWAIYIYESLQEFTKILKWYNLKPNEIMSIYIDGQKPRWCKKPKMHKISNKI